MSVNVLGMIGSMHEVVNLLLHNCIGLECELIHALELAWHDKNRTVMLEIDYFLHSSSGVTGYMHEKMCKKGKFLAIQTGVTSYLVLCNRLHTQNQV